MASPSPHTEALSPPPTKRLRLDSPPPTISTRTTTEAPAAGQNDALDSTSLELKVGITEYLNSTLAGFTGVLKQRYTDFLVNEITPEGEVVHLKSLDVPRRDGREQRKQGRAEEAKDGEAKAEKLVEVLEEKEAGSEVALIPVPTAAPAVAIEATISPEDHTELLALIGKEALTSLLALYTIPSSTPGTQTHHPPILTPRIDSKDSRTSIHRAMRRIFSGKFDTTTLESAGNEGVISITVSRNAGHTSRGGRPERSGRGGKRGGRGRGGGGGGGDQGERKDPYPNGKYLHFTLHKENRDTMDVVSMLGRILNLPRQLQQKTFAFAGTKDKRAVTTQRVSALKVNPERLAGANWPSTGGSGRGAWSGGRGGRGGGGSGGGSGATAFGLLRGCKVGDFEWKTAGLELGDLKGNEFLITLRDVTPTDTTPGDWASYTIGEQEARLRSIVEPAMDSLEKNGFINYYGLQRFGTFARGTHDVGVKMLRMDWKGAVDEIMHFDTSLTSLPDDAAAEKLRVSRDEFDRARALKIFSETVSNPSVGDYEKKLQDALFILPKKFLAENAIINAAKDRVGGGAGVDWLQCLMRIPRGLRLMYIHSYQSLVWNHVASERVKRFGGEGVVKGDLVLVDGNASTGKEEDADMEEDAVDQDGEPIVRDTSAEFQSLSAKLTREEGVGGSGFQRARPLTKEEAESRRYSIRDIVLPTPGYDIEYPGNELREVYVELMKKDGLDPVQMRRSVKEVSLSGAYRKVIGSVLGPVEWEVKRVRGLEQCVVTDLERVMEKRAKRGGVRDDEELKKGALGKEEDMMEIEGDGVQTFAAVNDEEKKSQMQEEPTKLAVVLKMQLGTSMYATMALREVMKAGGVQSYQPEFGHGHGQGR